MSTALLSADSAGRTIDGRFTLLRWLGGSESSSVFLAAFGEEPKTKAAIKFISADQADAQAVIAQWEAVRALSHPHLIELLQHGRCELDGKDLLYVVTEYAEEVLSEILPDRALTPAETREMLGPIVDALAFLHARNLVHGRLKPSNILVVNDRLKLSADRLHAAGEVAERSPSSWDAPETGTEKIAPAADLWSLGMVLVQTLTRQPPLWDRSKNAEPEIPASIPEPFFGIARECLRLDPTRRLTLSGVKTRLAPAPSSEPAAKSAGEQPSKAIAVAIVGALLGVGAVWTLHRIVSHPAAPPPAAPPQSSSAAPPPAPPPSPAPSARTPQAAVVNTPKATAAKGGIVKGEIASQVLPDVPQKIEGGIHGHIRVAIRVQVDPKGNIVQATIGTPGPSRYFANQALQAAQKWKFTPAWVGGSTAASVWLLHFQFGSTQIDATAQEESP